MLSSWFVATKFAAIGHVDIKPAIVIHACRSRFVSLEEGRRRNGRVEVCTDRLRLTFDLRLHLFIILNEV